MNRLVEPDDGEADQNSASSSPSTINSTGSYSMMPFPEVLYVVHLNLI